MIPQNENKSNARRKAGTKNKQGPQKPGHMINQQPLSQFISPSSTDTSGPSSVSDLIHDQSNAVLTEHSESLLDNYFENNRH
ncbi:hypothetical protein HPULCUR_012083 [Helicostylum pulchrum]|uniref:Uncharacterized protein n=1 Tax=Helicostylum pulchrum TaxID=562976 RepID=A0ABP9YI54_9FUNG